MGEIGLKIWAIKMDGKLVQIDFKILIFISLF